LHDAPDPGFVIWLTGLPRSGKSAVAAALSAALDARGHPVEVLEGDEAITPLTPRSPACRREWDEHVRRLAFVARTLARHGLIAVVPTVSPYREARDEARRELGRLVEVHVECALETCVARDGRGLYRKALAGELDEVPGISAPYEPPRAPEVVIRSEVEAPEAGAERVLRVAADLGYLPPARPLDRHRDALVR
jgi:adenylyl-sulfate kinase